MNMQTDPARIVGQIGAVVVAVLALLVAFGVPISDGQREAILGIVAALAPIVVAELIRYHVFAPSAVDGIADDHYANGYVDGHEEGIKTAAYNATGARAGEAPGTSGNATTTNPAP